MTVLQKGETLIAHESNYTTGALKINDAYDLYLVKPASGGYRLIIFMKLQFFFQDSGKYKWSTVDKTKFVNDWRTAVKTKWGNRALKTLPSGKQIWLNFRFETQIDGWMYDHWEITVKKIKPGGFSQSYVTPGKGEVMLDSEDLTFVNKGHSQKQRGVTHEFGHMLGIDDEYTKSSPHKTDYRSIMNRGETVLNRHDAVYMKWLNKIIKDKGIK